MEVIIIILHLQSVNESSINFDGMLKISKIRVMTLSVYIYTNWKSKNPSLKKKKRKKRITKTQKNLVIFCVRNTSHMTKHLMYQREFIFRVFLFFALKEFKTSAEHERVALITDVSSDSESEIELYKQISRHGSDKYESGEPTFTVEQGVEAIGFGWFQVRLYVICGLFTVSWFSLFSLTCLGKLKIKNRRSRSWYN